MSSVGFTPDAVLLWCGCAPSVLRPAIHVGCVVNAARLLEPRSWLYTCSFLSVQNRSSPNSGAQRCSESDETSKLSGPKSFYQTQNLWIVACRGVCGRSSPSVHWFQSWTPCKMMSYMCYSVVAYCKLLTFMCLCWTTISYWWDFFFMHRELNCLLVRATGERTSHRKCRPVSFLERRAQVLQILQQPSLRQVQGN